MLSSAVLEVQWFLLKRAETTLSRTITLSSPFQIIFPFSFIIRTSPISLPLYPYNVTELCTQLGISTSSGSHSALSESFLLHWGLISIVSSNVSNFPKSKEENFIFSSNLLNSKLTFTFMVITRPQKKLGQCNITTPFLVVKDFIKPVEST